MRFLQRAGRYPDLIDSHVRVYTRAIVGVDAVLVWVQIVVREFPEFSFIAEGLVLQCSQHYLDKLLKISSVVLVNICVFVPMTYCGQVRPNFELINPTMLVAPNNSYT